MIRRVLLTAILLVVTLANATAQPRETMKTVESRPGVTQPFVLVEPFGSPVASAILFTGGEGVLGFTGPGPFGPGGNFLVRNRRAFAAHGLLVAVIEVPSDHTAGYGRFRMSDAHARDVAAVIAALRQRAAVPVWVIGTSKGTVSAVNAAARLTTGGPDGLVITSSITRTTQNVTETVFDAGLADVRLPTLVAHHESDACIVTPGSDARFLIQAVRAPRKELLIFKGGAGGSSGESACGPWAAHGYYGIDDEVVRAIADWIKR